MGSDQASGIILDTSFLVAYHNDRDVHHTSALEIMEEVSSGEWGSALLPEYVFLELTTVLARRRDLATAVAAGESLLAAEEFEFVPCSNVFLDTFEIFRRFPATNLSFTDAAIVAIARRRDMDRVATYDRDFLEVEGLAVVPAPA